MTDTTKGLIFAAVLVVLAAALGIFIGLDRAPDPPPPVVPSFWIISKSKVEDIDGPKIRFDYSKDGTPCTVFLPDNKTSYDNYLAYLGTIGRVR